LTRGESTREKTRFEILRFLLQNEKHQRFNDIELTCSGSRNTVKKYLEELKDEGLIEQSLKGRHPYYLTHDGKKYTENEILKRKLKAQIDELSVERIKSLYELMNDLIMKCVVLTVDKAILEKMFESFRRGEISEEKLAEMEKEYAKWNNEVWTDRRFFSEEEIDRMARARLSREEIENLMKARDEWFKKWFGD